MAFKRCKFAAGVTLIEVMVSIVTVGVLALGSFSYEHLAVKHIMIARAQTTATSTAQLLLEDWKSTGGSTDYNPSSLGLGFSSASSEQSGSVAPMGSDAISSGAAYSVKIDGLPMVVALLYSDVAYDSEAEVTLRQLVVDVAFGEVCDNVLMQSKAWMGIPPVRLTTYVRVDGAGG